MNQQSTALRYPFPDYRSETDPAVLKSRFDEIQQWSAQMINGLPGVVCEFGLDLRITYMNRSGLDLFGYGQQDIDKGIGVLELFPPEQRERMRQDITAAMAGDFGILKNYEMVKRNGTLMHVRLMYGPILHDEAVSGVRACIIDFTEHESLQRQLIMSEDRFRRIFNKSAVGTVLFLRSGAIVESNVTFNTLLGIDHVDKTMPGIFDLFPSLVGQLGAARDVSTISYETEYQRPGPEPGTAREIRYLELRATALHPESADPVYLLEVYDQTLLKQKQRKDLDEAQSEIARTHREATQLRAELRITSALEGFITEDPATRQILGQLPEIAATRATVLINGESGTGKELVARGIHDLSPRSDGPFVAINCAAIPENLLESELFGYAAGAFTDAKKTTAGKLAQANNGTLFLDEIGDMSPMLQAKLLRVLQDHTYFPLGATNSQTADVRVIAATNKDLGTLVSDGKFREDLYYRIKVVRLVLPPLRERKSDIPLLCNHFLAQFNVRYQKNILRLHPDALDRLMEYNFPGNVRELSNLLEHAAVFCSGDTVLLENFPKDAFAHDKTATASIPDTGIRTLNDTTTSHIMKALEQAGGNKTEAARRLGIHKTTLMRKLKRADDGSAAQG